MTLVEDALVGVGEIDAFSFLFDRVRHAGDPAEIPAGGLAVIPAAVDHPVNRGADPEHVDNKGEEQR